MRDESNPKESGPVLRGVVPGLKLWSGDVSAGPKRTLLEDSSKFTWYPALTDLMGVPGGITEQAISAFVSRLDVTKKVKDELLRIKPDALRRIPPEEQGLVRVVDVRLTFYACF